MRDGRAVAMRDGLKLTLDNHFLNLEVETDAVLVKQLILGNNHTNHHLTNLMSDCRYLLEKLELVSLNFIFREANRYADILANQGAFLEDSLHVFVSSSQPHCIAATLVNAAIRVGYPKIL
ncbi:hypothetical protein ACSBR1_026179 [Camellia fascicularis]